MVIVDVWRSQLVVAQRRRVRFPSITPKHTHFLSSTPTGRQPSS